MTLYNKWLFALYGLSFPLLVTAVHFCLKALLARWAMACNGLERSSLSLLSRTGRVTLLTGLTTAADVACSNQSFLFISVTAYTIVKSSTPIWILAFSVCLGLRRCSWRQLLVVAMIVLGITIVALSPVEIDGATVAAMAEQAAVDGDGDAAAGGAARRLQRRLRALLTETAVAEETTTVVTPVDVDAADAADAALLAQAVSARLFGFALVLAASLCAGLRWACSQLLLTGVPAKDPVRTHAEEGAEAEAEAEAAEGEGEGEVAEAEAAVVGERLHPYVLVFGTSLTGALVLIPVAAAIEMRRVGAYIEEHASDPHSLLAATLAMSCVGGLLAFLLLVAEIRVVALTSGLSLAVAGVFKEVLTVLASTVILGEVLTPPKALGLALCVAGLLLYTVHEVKHRE